MAIKLSEKQIREGWQIVKFREIAKSISERVEPAETDLEVYVGLEHLDPQSLRITRCGVPSDVKGQKLRVRPGQIIFGKRRAYQKKLAVADFDGICSAHAMVLETVPGKIIPELLPFFMQSDMFMDRAVAISEGSLSPTIKWKTLAIQEFPLPPLKRQKEILEVLEKVEESLMINEQVNLKANILFLSLLQASYKKTKSSNDSVSICKLKDLANIRMGSSPSSKAYNDIKQGLPLLQGKADLIERKSKPRIYTSQITKECYVGDILLSVRAPVGYVSISNHNACIGRGVAALSVNSEYDKDYIYYALMSQEQEWQKISQGGIFDAINSKELKNISVAAPSKEMQRKISSAIKLADLAIKNIERKKAHFNSIKQKLIKHFQGGSNEL